ncbi:MAG: 50S ribosomal protein L24 [Candidatus Paceibacterota bacterium]
MNVKKGDTVEIIAGNDRGKTGTVDRVIPKENRVVVEGINIRKKHTKITSDGGGIIEKAMPIHASNVRKIKE